MPDHGHEKAEQGGQGGALPGEGQGIGQCSPEVIGGEKVWCQKALAHAQQLAARGGAGYLQVGKRQGNQPGHGEPEAGTAPAGGGGVDDRMPGAGGLAVLAGAHW